jgi:UDP-N-acetylmuramate--alanine ligase
LVSRTRDFLDDFAKALSELDDVVLLPIYPARELPIEGVTSDVLVNDITSSAKQVLLPTQAIEYAASSSCEVILTIGAGDIDRIVEPLKSRLS